MRSAEVAEVVVEHAILVLVEHRAHFGEREIFSNTKQIQHSRVIWGLEPCSRARETCRQGCQVDCMHSVLF